MGLNFEQSVYGAFRNRLFTDQQQAHRSPSWKPDTNQKKVFRLSRMFLLVTQESLSKIWNTHECQAETNSDTALFYTAFYLNYAQFCILTASLKQSVQETLVNLLIST